MKQFDPYGGAECGIGLLHIDFDNLSRSNTVLCINKITPNVTVRSPIYQPMVMPIMFNNGCHDAIRMYKCPAYHRRRTAFPNLTCSFPNPVCILHWPHCSSTFEAARNVACSLQETFEGQVH